MHRNTEENFLFQSGSVSRSVVSDSLQPYRLQPTKPLCPWNSSGKNTEVGCHALLQGIFPTHGSNPNLLHCRQILYRGAFSFKISPINIIFLFLSVSHTHAHTHTQAYICTYPNMYTYIYIGVCTWVKIIYEKLKSQKI